MPKSENAYSNLAKIPFRSLKGADWQLQICEHSMERSHCNELMSFQSWDRNHSRKAYYVAQHNASDVQLQLMTRIRVTHGVLGIASPKLLHYGGI